jgi:hypothetical protein
METQANQTPTTIQIDQAARHHVEQALAVIAPAWDQTKHGQVALRLFQDAGLIATNEKHSHKAVPSC